MAPAAIASAQVADQPDARSTDLVCFGDYDSSFDDIAGSAHEENILCAADYGITQGLRDPDLYGPRLDVTRGQMASFITRFIQSYDDSADLPNDGDPDRFDDVPESGYPHSDAINWLASVDIVQGTNASGGDSYDPQAAVTRGQMASFIRRSLSYLDTGTVNPLSEPPAEANDFFADDTGSVHARNIDAITGVGIVQGFDDGTYRPQADVKRDQMASFIMRAYDYAEGENLGDQDGAPPVDPDDEVTDFEGVRLSWQNEPVNGDPAGSEPIVYSTGDPNADGSADISVNETDNSITYTVDYSEVDGPFTDAPGFHVHDGDLATNGPVVVTLATPAELEADADQVITATVTVDEDDFDVSDIVDDPTDYYLNLHSEDFPAGAIRGQLPDGGQDLIDFETIEVAVDGDEDVIEGDTVSYTASNLNDDLVYRATLVDADSVSLDDDGDIVFDEAADQDEGQTAVPGDRGDNVITDVNGTPQVMSMNTFGGIDPVDGEIALDVEVGDEADDFHVFVYHDNGVAAFGGNTLLDVEGTDADGFSVIETYGYSFPGTDIGARTPTQIEDVAGTQILDLGFTTRDRINIGYTRDVERILEIGGRADQFELNGETAVSIGGAGSTGEPNDLLFTFPGDTFVDGENTFTYTGVEGDEILDVEGEPVLTPDSITFDFDLGARTPTEITDVELSTGLSGEDTVDVTYSRDVVGAPAGLFDEEQFELNGVEASRRGALPGQPDRIRIAFPDGTAVGGDNTLTYTESDVEGDRLEDVEGFDVLSPDEFDFVGGDLGRTETEIDFADFRGSGVTVFYTADLDGEDFAIDQFALNGVAPTSESVLFGNPDRIALIFPDDAANDTGDDVLTYTESDDVDERLQDVDGFDVRSPDTAIVGDVPIERDVIDVTPDTQADVVEDSTREYTASGLDADTEYRITLVDSDNVTVDADGNVTFADDAENDGAGDGIADAGPPDSSLAIINGEDVSTNDPDHTTGGVSPDADGDITFTAEAGVVGDSYIPVVYVDGGESTFLELDDENAPIEFFGLGGQTDVVDPATRVETELVSAIQSGSSVIVTYDGDLGDQDFALDQFELNGATPTSEGILFGNDDQLQLIFDELVFDDGDNTLTYTQSDDADERVEDVDGFDVLSPDEVTFDGTRTATEITDVEIDVDGALGETVDVGYSRDVVGAPASLFDETQFELNGVEANGRGALLDGSDRIRIRFPDGTAVDGDNTLTYVESDVEGSRVQDVDGFDVLSPDEFVVDLDISVEFDVLDVQPDDAADVESGATRDFSVSGLDATTEYRITLVDADNVMVDADGNTTFVVGDAPDAPGTDIAAAGPPEAVLATVNGAAGPTDPDHTVGGVLAVAGEITFTAEAGPAGDAFVPVVYVDGGASTFLEVDDAGAPIEFFGTGGETTSIAAPPRVVTSIDAATFDGLNGVGTLGFVIIDWDRDVTGGTAAQLTVNGTPASLISTRPNGNIRAGFPDEAFEVGDNTFTYTAAATNPVVDSDGIEVATPDSVTFTFTP